MELKDLQITDGLWDFIEANVPNYHEREDVLRQAQLQLLIAGHESTVAGITRDEAILLRDKIVYGLCVKAIAAFTGEAISGNGYLRDYAEALADISYEAGKRRLRLSGNSRETIGTLIHWADEFSRRHKDTDWIDKEYLDEIYNFTEEKLQTAQSGSDPESEFEIAFLDRAALERYGYDTKNITDNDLQKLAGLMGDHYRNSSGFGKDLHAACKSYGLNNQ
ncbi:hypothetical protein [Alistipes finegoldii]|uniref:hypothetical protein n=1 Tax=Alistipes finegoldii TaxID=214856 RepID=UPI003AF5BA2D